MSAAPIDGDGDGSGDRALSQPRLREHSQLRNFTGVRRWLRSSNSAAAASPASSARHGLPGGAAAHDVGDNIFHQKCFRCTKCERQLQKSNVREDAVTGRLYCKPHFHQLAATAGLQAAATGGIDTLGVLVEKRKKEELEEELESLVVGSAVWVEVADRGAELRPLRALSAADNEPFVRADVVEARRRGVPGVRAGRQRRRRHRPIAAALVYRADLGGSRVNNLQLLQLNEPNLLYNIKSRFEAGQMYTYTGQLELLAVNPYEAIEGLYDEERMRSTSA